jgi:hypothetical protein
MRILCRFPLAACVLAPFVAAACATLPFNYQPTGPVASKTRGVVAVGDVSSNNPYPDPARIRFNATVDRPVPQAVREALVVELGQAGFTVGAAAGARQVTAMLKNVIMDENNPSITFTVTAPEDGRTLYRREFASPLKMDTIFDADGFAASVRGVVQQFVRDPDALSALSAAAPPPPPPDREPSAAPAAGAKPWWQ